MPLALLTALAGFALVAAACGDEGEAARPAASHATLRPASTTPLRLQGSGFHAGERVRVTVTPSTSDGVTRHVRAGRRGSFVVGFPGVDACGGLEGVARGSRGSHASFQFSTGIGC
jgi:hypothetical protein